MPDPKRLDSLQSHEVSVVDRAANLRRFLVTKAAAPVAAVAKFLNLGPADPPAIDFTAALARRDEQDEDQEQDSLLWKLTSALQEAIDSITDDPNCSDKETAAATCVQQFYQALLESRLLDPEQEEGIEMPGVTPEAAAVLATPEFQKSLLTMITEGIAKAMGKKKPAADDAETESEKDFSNLSMADKEKAKTKKAAEDLEKAAVPEAIQKQLDDLKKAASDANTRAEAAEKLAKAEQDKTLTREYLAKAEAFDHLPGKPAEVGAILKALNDTDPKQAEAIETLLKAANEAARQGDLFKSIGTGGQGGGATDADTEATTLAKSYLEKGLVPTIEAGIAKAYNDNKGLYARHKAEQSAR